MDGVENLLNAEITARSTSGRIVLEVRGELFVLDGDEAFDLGIQLMSLAFSELRISVEYLAGGECA